MSLRFVFFVPGMPFDGSTPGKTGLGGSESAGLYLARALVARGNEVMMFCNCEAAGRFDGVDYLPAGMFPHFSRTTPHDVTVVQRTTEPLTRQLASKLSVLWVHDLAMARTRTEMFGACWNIDLVATVSAFHTQQWRDALDLPESLFLTSRNGVDLDLVKREIAEAGPRDRKSLLFCARPERGLDVLLDKVMPRILEAEPEATLHLAGYENTVEHMAAFYEQINLRIGALGPRAQWHGSLAKGDLYRLMARCGVYAYPTPGAVLPSFREVSCILGMEAQACGLPIVTSALGALPETIGFGAGALIDGTPADEGYVERFVAACLAYMRHDEAHDLASLAGRRHAEYALSWDGVAEQWERACQDAILARNDSPVRLARHFIRMSDIMAAEEVIRRGLNTYPEDSAIAAELRELDKRLSKDWAFRQSRDAYREQYEKIGHTHTDAFAGGSQEDRLQVIGEWFAKQEGIRSIVDVGCGLGIYAINLSNRLGPDVAITGIDVDKSTVAWAEKYRLQHAQHPEALRFITGDEREAVGELADAGMACEVMEHVPDPTEFLALVEAKVKPGGWVYVTVPFGPWEEISYRSYPHRCHLWHFEPQDLVDLLKAKSGLSIQARAGGFSPIDGSVLGHYHMRWKADHQPFGKIDMERKLSLQRPRETLSVCLMAGGDAVGETLDWCVKSWLALADEIVVADTGLTVQDRARLEIHGARIFPAPDPKREGFETPRNLALAHARSDWMLWIDLDERMLNSEALPKYLRRSIFDGFGMRQHHFAVDTTFDPDLPVRLVRIRNRNDGKQVRFWGMIHEHPEVAVNEGPGRVIILNDVHIAHVGYLHESGRRSRFWRNKPMLDRDRIKYPDRRLQKHFVMRDNMLLVRYHLEMGGQMTPELIALCEEVVALFREYFLGKPTMTGVNSLQYYSQALKLLNRGLDVAFDIRAGRDGLGDAVGPSAMRFETAEDALAELKARAEQAMAPYTSAAW